MEFEKDITGYGRKMGMTAGYDIKWENRQCC